MAKNNVAPSASGLAYPLLEAALTYAKRGWPVFPCNSAKAPYTKNGVVDATTDAAVITAWWATWPMANIGFDVGGAGMMVVDIDAYKPGFDKAALDALNLPATHLRAKSPRGGEHLFYELARGEIVSNDATGKLAPGVDVRSFHGYVLLAPSATADGSYEWLEQGKPSYRTDEMVRLANSHREKSGDRDNWSIEPDLPENVASAVEWLKTKAKVSVEGQGGDSMAYATAAHLKSFGISQALAFDLMWEHWNPRCVPPWHVDEVEHLEQKVINGYSYNTSPPGNITLAYKQAKTKELFKPIEEELPSGRQVTAGRFRIVDRDGMAHIKPPTWLVRNCLVQQGYAVLGGAPGTFKTFVGLDLALSVAACFLPDDAAWFNSIVEPGRVLFVAGEGRAQISNRVSAWEKTHWGGHKVMDFALADPVPNIATVADADAFIKAALALSPEGYKLLVLDTVGRAMQGVNENAQEHASNFTKFVERLQRELGAAVLALHHTGHEETTRVRGSSVFGADADTIIMLERTDKNYLVSLKMTKQKDAAEWEKPMVIKLEEIHLSSELTSLVAVAPTKDETKIARDATSGTRDDSMTMRGIHARFILAALRSIPGKHWSITELAGNARKHGCTLAYQTLRTNVLGVYKGKPGWARTHSALRPYFDLSHEEWRSPGQLPPIEPGFDLKDDEIQ